VEDGGGRRRAWARVLRTFGAEGGSFGTYSMAVDTYRWLAAGGSGEVRRRPARWKQKRPEGRKTEGGKERLATGEGETAAAGRGRTGEEKLKKK